MRESPCDLGFQYRIRSGNQRRSRKKVCQTENKCTVLDDSRRLFHAVTDSRSEGFAEAFTGRQPGSGERKPAATARTLSRRRRERALRTDPGTRQAG
jgi:hypothetical protein